MLAISILFLFNVLSVAARSYQQLNVVHYKWLAIIPTSYGMQAKDFVNIGLAAPWAVSGDWQMVLIAYFVASTGAWLGCWAGMWLHKRIFRGKA